MNYKNTNLKDYLKPLNLNEKKWKSLAELLAKRLINQYGLPMHWNKSDPTDELFFIILSKKTRPEVYLKVFDTLSRIYKPWTKLLDISANELTETIKSTGMANIRSDQILRIAKQLKNDFGSVSLDPLKKMTMDEAYSYLLSLPGIGEKSARCVLMYSLGYDISPMDTHANRVMKRFGLLPEDANAKRSHWIMDNLIPKDLSLPIHVTLVSHGRRVCTYHKPKCEICVVSDKCSFMTKM